MITTVVQFQISEDLTPEMVRRMFVESVPKFINLPGLIRKYYMLAEGGSYATSVYLWSSRQAAEAFHSEAWAESMRLKYGFAPSVAYYECAVVVDNAIGEVLTDV